MDGSISFLDFPNELLQVIASKDRPFSKSLSALSQTCRRLYSVATPELYRSVVLWGPETASRFVEVTRGTHFAPLVRELQFHYHFLDKDTKEMLLYPRALRHFTMKGQADHHNYETSIAGDSDRSLYIDVFYRIRLL